MDPFQDSHFLNVDLDIESSSDLSPIASFLGDRVWVLYNDIVTPGGLYLLSLEPNPKREISNNPERYIRFLVDLIDSFPLNLMKLWNKSTSRVFDIGFSGGIVPKSESNDEFQEIKVYKADLSPEMAARLSRLRATIRITVYPYQPEPNKATAADAKSRAAE